MAAAMLNEPVDFDPWIRSRTAEREAKRGRFGERAADAYMAVLALFMVVLFATGIAQAFTQNFRTGLEGGLLRPGLGVVPPASAASALLMVALLAMLSLFSRLGPSAVDRAQGFWWLSLPVRRTPFLARLLRQRLVWIIALGLVLWIPLGIALLDAGQRLPAAVGIGLGALCLGLMLAVLALIAAVAQFAGRARWIRGGLGFGTTALALVYALDAVLHAAGHPGLERLWAVLPVSWPAAAQGGAWWIVPALAASVAGLFAYVAPRLERNSSRELMARGASSAHAGAALAMLDTKVLGSAIEQAGAHESRRQAAQRESIRRRGSDAFGRMLPAALARGPLGALMRAEALVLLRTGSVWSSLAAGLLLPVAGTLAVGAGQPVALCTLVLIGACIAAKGAGAAAAQAADVPALDSIIPLGRGAIRRAHGAVAGILLAVYGAVLAAYLGWAVALDGRSVGLLVAIGVLAGIGLAAGTVRLAYRPGLDWGSVMVLALMNKATQPLLAHFTRGYDVMVLAVIPLLVGLFLAPVPPMLAVVALVVAGVAWFTGTHVADRPPPRN
ncbi:DUF6297 family protein [Paeniglutamicibacter cryotolerans]|uniref:Uncharacterized protein n=1 Tax=Paeniglutamicibacter cryotolerans TaxID=670079 RepID=A0A839QG29_9MICC|nr:DUF6297 family protein [Paeniglutamicibacter cryotolerans]MBB2995268.1 hypothetical protein [Paeniglutamicibacter cryotolerans]